jgi:hypothetical protein
MPDPRGGGADPNPLKKFTFFFGTRELNMCEAEKLFMLSLQEVQYK